MTTEQTACNPKIEPHQWTDGGDRVLILRKIKKDGTSYGGFARWGKPEELNITIVPDKFVADANCGNGLHGWAWGMGLGDGADYSIIDDRWLILSAKPEDVVGNVGGGLKVKCREALKIFDGTFAGAWALINRGRHRLIEAMAKGKGSGVASGDYSTAASSGNNSKAHQDGKSGIAASIGIYGEVMAGELGCIVAFWWNSTEKRYRAVVGYIGENGILANTKYRLNDKHEFKVVQ